MKSIFAPRALTPERAEVVRKVIVAALEAVNPARAVEAVLRLEEDCLWAGNQAYPLASTRRVLLAGVGKAAAAMGQGVMQRLGAQIEAGVLICKHLPQPGEENFPTYIRCLPGNHPVPGEDSQESTRQLAELLAGSDAHTLVVCVISGGGSALMTLPYEGIALADLQELTRQLLACGAEIGEINILRSHIDRIKGGGLAQLCAPAQMVSLILSDVVGSPLAVIASGPTSADPSTFGDALAILEKYHLQGCTAPSILHLLRVGAAGKAPETLKDGDRRLRQVQNVIVGENQTAGAAALAAARQMGFHGELLPGAITGEASLAGRSLAERLRRAQSGRADGQPLLLVGGGETTVTLHGEGGLGGRNLEVALAAVEPLAGVADAALVTLATDGEDGPTPAAGAVVTGESLGRAHLLDMEPGAALAQHDSFPFFESLGDLVVTGPTGTNVNDLNLLFVF